MSVHALPHSAPPHPLIEGGSTVLTALIGLAFGAALYHLPLVLLLVAALILAPLALGGCLDALDWLARRIRTPQESRGPGWLALPVTGALMIVSLVPMLAQFLLGRVSPVLLWLTQALHWLTPAIRPRRLAGALFIACAGLGLALSWHFYPGAPA